MKELLTEWCAFNVDSSMVSEAIRENSGKLIVSGVMQRANAKNQNGRIYKKALLEREIERYNKNEIAQRRALGELDHSDTSTVNLKNVSHNIVECWWKGDDLYGKIEILNTPAGNILKELFKSGITVGISSRGMGSVKPLSEGDAMEVQNDFELVTFDFVSNPSTHGAFMSPVKESVDKTNYYMNAHKLAHDILCEMAGVCCIKGV